jgi:hypothetical protein
MESIVRGRFLVPCIREGEVMVDVCHPKANVSIRLSHYEADALAMQLILLADRANREPETAQAMGMSPTD